MTLYRCCEDWEHSQRDDSDWYCVAYDDVKDCLTRVETGSTRYANGLNHGGHVVSMIPEMQEKAFQALIRLWFTVLQTIEKFAVEEPKIETLEKGIRVRFLEAHRCMQKVKNSEESACKKCCDNPGKWVNPRNSSDVRECFACKGTGKYTKIIRTKAVGPDNKPIWEQILAGATGTVINQATFGTFYRNGYNQPGRRNTTIYLLLDDGREVQAPASKLRLDREMVSEQEIQQKAENCAKNNGYYPLFATAGCRI